MSLIKKTPEKFKEVTLSDYEKMKDIERTLHICDVLERNRYTLSTAPISNKDQSHLRGKNMRILWFAVAEHQDQNHWYGNVSFRIKLRDILSNFPHKKMYFLEVIERISSIQSRILITSKRLESVQPAIPFDIKSLGFPIHQDSLGNFYHLNKIRDEKSHHILEILIDIDDDNEAGYIFQMSRRSAVDHSMANSGEFCACYKYNTRQETCPHPHPKEETTRIISTLLPGYLTISSDSTAPMNKLGQHIFRSSKRPDNRSPSNMAARKKKARIVTSRDLHL
ncbi:unnamed protein product [Meganyctiphanes norvegica]|uniref:SWIM-type domain-containing protein n=1 Tax=Meganyctiphanes norvegica TaxID=48144 RepID=A0AAV2R0H8_MEGNR